MNINQRDININRIARQHADAILALTDRVNRYGLTDQDFEDERDRLADQIVQALYRTDARWLATQQAAMNP